MLDRPDDTPVTAAVAPEPQIWQRLTLLWRGAGQTARLMIGVPDYQTYVEHVRLTHPETPPMSYEAFFRSRMEARYAGRARGCC